MKKIAVFDFDGTLFKVQTIPFFIEQWEELNYPKMPIRSAKSKILKIYFLYKFKLLSEDKFRARAVSDFLVAFNNMYKEDIDEFFYKASLNALTHLRDSIIKEINRVKSEGYSTVLLSGCYESFLKCIANEVGIDNIIGSKINYNEYYKIDAANPANVLGGFNKLEKLNEFFQGQIDYENSLAYADSHTDLELLRAFGNPVAVHPNNDLISIAKDEGFRIID